MRKWIPILVLAVLFCGTTWGDEKYKAVSTPTGERSTSAITFVLVPEEDDRTERQETSGREVASRGGGPLRPDRHFQLDCPDGTSFVTGSGSSGGECIHDRWARGEQAWCESEAGMPQGLSWVRCDKGCLSETGPTCCCQLGTEGCETNDTCGEDSGEGNGDSEESSDPEGD